MLTDTETATARSVLLSLLVAAVVVGIAIVKEKVSGRRAAAAEVPDKVG